MSGPEYLLVRQQCKCLRVFLDVLRPLAESGSILGTLAETKLQFLY